MRLLLAAAAALVAVAAAVYWAGNGLGNRQVASTASRPAVGQPDRGAVQRTSTRRHRSVRRERLTASDTRIARAAVVQPRNLLPVWRRVPVSQKEGTRCSSFRPDVSAFVVSGRARSAFVLVSGYARITSSVKLFRTPVDAGRYFDVTNGPRVLRCLREGLDAGFRASHGHAHVVAARMLSAPPPVGTRTAIYTLVVSAKVAGRNEWAPFPVDVVAFQSGRGIGAVSFENVANDKLELARAVASRLP